jgi:hypothetical protein
MVRTGRPGNGAFGAFCWVRFLWSLTFGAVCNLNALLPALRYPPFPFASLGMGHPGVAGSDRLPHDVHMCFDGCMAGILHSS